MSSRLIQVLLALSLLLNTFVLVGFVYRSWIEPPAFERHRRRRRPARDRARSRRWRTTSTSTKRSARRCSGVFDQYSIDASRAAARDPEAARADRRRIQASPTVDMARVDALIDQLTKLRAELQKENLRALDQLDGAAQARAARAHAPDPGRAPGHARSGSGRQAAAARAGTRTSAAIGASPWTPRIGRRGFVGGAAALSAGLWLPRPGRAATAMDFDEARHLLSRTSFGATPAEIRALEAQDYAGAVDRLLAQRAAHRR